MTEKLVDDPSPPPDNLRCRRTDGKNWRCKNFSADNVRRYCIKHFISYQAIFNKSSKQNDNTDDKKKKDEEEEEVPSETQTKKTRLNETSSGLEEEKEPESVAVRVLDNNGGVGSLAKELESFAARVSNFSGGDCAFVKELMSLATGVSNTSAGCGLEEVESETLAEARVSNANGSGLGKDSESLAVGVSEKTSGGGGSWLKKTKTRFTKEQKEKMMEFGKRWGWRIRNNNEAAVRKFCDETGIKRVALKIWMYYTKHAIARASNSSGGGVGRRSPLKKRSYTKFTQEQKDKMVEFGERLGWRFRKQYMMQQFSDEIGVKVHVLKSWLRNKRKSLVSNPSGCGGGGGKLSKRGSRTLYTQEQMNKMMEFGERLGWRTRKKDKAVVQQFCDEIGVKVQTLKSWIQNKKISLGRNFSKKKSRTTFTQEQKDKMLEFGERLGWRIMKKDKAVVHQFCDETGVKVQTLKSWMQNQKNKLGYESQEGRLDSQSKRRKVETQKRCLEADTKRCSAEPQLGETRKHVGELEKVLEVDKTNELSVELEKKKLDCIEIQDKYRDGLKEWISCLEDQKVISEREKRAQERITNFRIARLEEDNKFVRDREKRAQERIKYMEEELTKARDEIEKFQLETSNRKFDCGKRRADDDIEVCGKRFSDLETRVLRMEEDNSSLRSVESHVCGHLDSEPQDLQNEDSHNDGGEIYEKDRKKRSKLQGKTNGGTKEKVFNANEKIHASTSAGNGTRESRADFQINKRKVGTGKERSETGTKRCGGDSVENLKDLLELEKDLEVYKTKYHEVSVELEKKKKECAAVQDKYEHGLKQWTSCLEDQKVIGVRQRSAQERITNLRIASLEEDKTRAEKRVTYLEEELRKTGRDERERYVQLITDNKYLGCARRAAEDETEAWKKRFCVLEARVMRMEEENPSLRYMECHACGKREFGLGGLQKEFSHIDEGGINEKKINKLASAFTGPSSIDVQCEPFVNDEEKEKNTPSEFKVEYSNKVRKEVVLDLERNPGKRQSELKLGGFELASDGGDRDRDSENSLKRSWEIEENLVSKKCLKRLCLDQRGEEYGSNCADLTVTSIHNQKRTSEILNRESGDEVEVEMMKCPGLEHEVLKPSPMNLFSETSHVSSRGQDVKLRKNELEWKFEADMLSSFEENPELCMKAVCALYRRQTSEENPMTGFSHYTNRGFNEFDALRGTNLVEFLMDGDRKGDLKKSVKELEIFDPKALGECKRLAILYSEQLFNIYHNKEDPFFLPSSAVC